MTVEPFVKCGVCVFNFLIMCLTVFPVAVHSAFARAIYGLVAI